MQKCIQGIGTIKDEALAPTLKEFNFLKYVMQNIMLWACTKCCRQM